MTNVAKVVFSAMLLGACAQPADLPGTEPVQVLRSSSVALAERHDSSPPLLLMRLPDRDTNPEHEVKPVPRRYQPGTRTHAPTIQAATPSMAAPTSGLGFDGVGNGFTGPSGTFSVGAAPPDTNGDVGPNHYVQTVNTNFAVFNKSGTALYGPVPINTLWSGFGGGCQTNNDGDPLVVYDPIADRWVISQFSVSTTPYLQCIAVSQTSDPTGAYYRYSFSYGTGFNDYPKMGVWPDGYYFTYNIFTNGQTFAGAKVCAMDRVRMLSGAAATQQCFDTSTSYGGLLPADLDGATQPPSGEPNFILGLGTTPTTLALWKFHVDWTTPANSTFTGPTTLTVASYAEACNGGTCIPQAGTTQQLDSLADRMMYRLQYRNFTGTGAHESLVTNHSVTAGSSTGVRWYEIRNPNGTPTVYQQGTFAPDSNYRWMGSAAMDGSGGIGLAYSVSSSSAHPSLQYTGRNAGDALGTMTAGEGVLIAGGGSQLTNLSRWGDYSNISVDPVDDCTFWFTSEYIPANGTFNWRTRIGTFKLSGCGAPPPPPDTTPPTTSITAPANGATVSGTTTVTATASDNVGVTKVEIYVDSALATSCASSPCSYAWNTTTATNASHTLSSKAYDAAGNVGTSSAVTVTVSNAASCATSSQLLGNPGFESGATTWTQTAGVIDGTTAGSAPRTGSWKAWLDGYGTTHVDDLYQTVAIPAGACKATLSFWLKITTAETTTTTAYDVLTVTVRNSSGAVLATLGTYSNLDAGTSYLQKSFDVTSYKGQSVRIQFHGTEDASLQTSFFIDDTALTVTQ